MLRLKYYNAKGDNFTNFVEKKITWVNTLNIIMPPYFWTICPRGGVGNLLWFPELIIEGTIQQQWAIVTCNLVLFFFLFFLFNLYITKARQVHIMPVLTEWSVTAEISYTSSRNQIQRNHIEISTETQIKPKLSSIFPPYIPCMASVTY